MKVRTGCWDCRGERGQATAGRKVLVNAKEWQLKPLRREKDYSRKVPVNEKNGSWNSRGERKITADEHQPAWKVSSWEPTSTKGWQLKPPRRERKITANVPSTAERLTEQETIRQSINDNLISKYHSIMCKLQHVNYSATLWLLRGDSHRLFLQYGSSKDYAWQASLCSDLAYT